MIENFHRIARTVHEPILIGGLVTMIANAIGLRQPLLHIVPLGRFQPMNIHFCFNRGIIWNLGPGTFELLINNQLMPLFTPHNPRTSIHDRNNGCTIGPNHTFHRHLLLRHPWYMTTLIPSYLMKKPTLKPLHFTIIFYLHIRLTQTPLLLQLLLQLPYLTKLLI